MELPDGIPTLEAMERLRRSEGFGEMLRFSDQFLLRFRRILRGYRWNPGTNPLRNWSRQWEYPFAWQRLRELAAGQAAAAPRVLDAGSGLTFFPYYVAGHLPGARVTCCDCERAYAPKFRAISRILGHDRVEFVVADLRNLPFPDASFDALYCLSVLEHTGEYGRILDEFRRILSPGGLVIITFDISLDGRCQVRPDHARELLGLVAAKFGLDPGPWLGELGRLERPEAILTTDHARATEPELLPWRLPLLKSFYDLFRGRGWTGGFFSLSCFGLSARAPGGRM